MTLAMTKLMALLQLLEWKYIPMIKLAKTALTLLLTAMALLGKLPKKNLIKYLKVRFLLETV